jgi:hypothetical protein
LSACADSGVIVAAIAEQLRGVGHSIAFIFAFPLLPPFPGRHGVGQNPDSLSLVWRTNVARAQHTPFRIIPQRGQVSENSSKPARSEHWGVFHEDVAGSYLANDSGHVVPHSAARSVDSCASSGCADVLAWEAPADDIDAPAPRFPVEGLHVVPDWEAGQASVPLSGEEALAGVLVPFDSTDGGMSKKHSAENTSSGSSE